MVTSGMQATSAQRASSTARKSATRQGLRPSAAARNSPAASSPHLVLQQPAWEKAEADQRKRARASVKAKRTLKVKGEMKSMLGVVGVFAAICTFGVIYLAAYAGVASQSHQITLLQQQLNAAQAQHEVYVQQLTVLSSAARVQALATQQGMVMSGSAHYLTLTASGQDGAAVTRMATAR